MAELSRLGRYELRRVLGKGAMGVVYDAYDPTINRRVAIKVILKSQAIDEATARDYSARFVREAQAAGRISHPNIIQVHDFGEQDDIAYLVLEFIEGRDLRSYFSAKEPFEIKESVRIMVELLAALEFAHEAGVIHRDVKPANVMLDMQRRVKLADFGVARIQDAERTGADTMVGTPAFMSPEQISGLKIDHRTDIFSAGSILYQLLTGEQPFKGEGAWTVAKKIMQHDPPLPSRVAISVAPAFDEIVSRALAKDPERRFANAREFADALREILEGRTQMPAPVSLASVAALNAINQRTKPDLKANEAEIGFWRSIQDSDDPAELELYLDQFPDGIYAKLAGHKIAKLHGAALPKGAGAGGTSANQAEQGPLRFEAGEQARQETAGSGHPKADGKVGREAKAKALTQSDPVERAEFEAAAKAEGPSTPEFRQLVDPPEIKPQEPARGARAVVDDIPTVAAARLPATPTGRSKGESKPLAIPAIAAAVAIAGGVVAYMMFGRTPEPKTEIAAIGGATEDRAHIESGDRARSKYKDAATATAGKAASDRPAPAKSDLGKIDAEKTAAEKPVAGRAAPVVPVQQAPVSTGSAPSVAPTSGVIVNAQAVSAQTLRELQKIYPVPVVPGRYWYDPVSGAYGNEGGPILGQMLPGLALGGPLRADASHGTAPVFINGRQLTFAEKAYLEQTCRTVVAPGRYWVNAQGLGGTEGGPVAFNLALCAPPARTNSGSSSRTYCDPDGTCRSSGILGSILTGPK
jgi:serine/threonine-protein kinase